MSNASGRFRLWPHSIRWQLQLWLGLLLVGVLTGFGVAVFELQRANHNRQIDADLELRVAALNRAVRDAPFTRAVPLAANQAPSGGFAPDRQPPPERGSNGGFRRGPPPGPPPSGPPPSGLPPSVPPPSGPPPGGGRKVRPAPTRSTPNALGVPSATAALFDGGGYYYAIWYRNGALLNSSANLPTDLPPPGRLDRDTLTHWRTRGPFREAIHCTGLADCALAGISFDANPRPMRNFAAGLLGAGAAVLALGLGIGWWITTRAIRPLEQITAAAGRISHGNLSERIAVQDAENELGQLACVLNSTFAKLDAAFTLQRQFTADAAHELRTPLAVIITESQATLARERTAAEYKEALQACLETAQEMRSLTESLLELSSFDEAASTQAPSDFDLAHLARQTVARIQPLAQVQNVRLAGEFGTAAACGNAARVDRVIANLVANALFYNRDGGAVHVATSATTDAAILTVADTGIGISPEELAHIFERFYRVDRARSRAGGHTGLGLAICQAIVQAERGTIHIESQLSVGTTVTVRLPKNNSQIPLPISH